jgi:MinD-like ATPase involved in chromosome partitioning or flagellar assembly
VYTITFYSFKGGVGRTLALVNVAALLAQMGRNVLLVDFDLEAPGLETFDRLRPPEYHPPRVEHKKAGGLELSTRTTYTPSQPGMVEYVTEYMRTKRAPDVRGYVYSTGTVGEKGGQLWVMPAGRRDAEYQSALARIDWLALYREHDGFLLFEDTKAQWEQEFKPDYVLIDSRTGHTDVEGICTRQLPDAVVALFFPNEQNLVGLKEVCRRIRNEESSGLMKRILLYFVMSNVPDLDDEEGILQHWREEFNWELEFEGDEPDVVIHRHESAMLINQSIFVLDRPKSRLAREYEDLMWKLIMHNPVDRDGSLRFLRECCKALTLGAVTLTPGEAQFRRHSSGTAYGHYESNDDPAALIASKFPDDAEIQEYVRRFREAEKGFRAAVAAKSGPG